MRIGLPIRLARRGVADSTWTHVPCTNRGSGAVAELSPLNFLDEVRHQQHQEQHARDNDAPKRLSAELKPEDRVKRAHGSTLLWLLKCPFLLRQLMLWAAG
jgi:hypothetical protein